MSTARSTETSSTIRSRSTARWCRRRRDPPPVPAARQLPSDRGSPVRASRTGHRLLRAPACPIARHGTGQPFRGHHLGAVAPPPVAGRSVRPGAARRRRRLRARRDGLECYRARPRAVPYGLDRPLRARVPRGGRQDARRALDTDRQSQGTGLGHHAGIGRASRRPARRVRSHEPPRGTGLGTRIGRPRGLERARRRRERREPQSHARGQAARSCRSRVSPPRARSRT